MGEVILAHWNNIWGTTESLLRRRRGGNVATASMLAQIVTMPAQTVDESSYITVLSNNGSYLITRSSPFQAHTVDPLLLLMFSLFLMIISSSKAWNQYESINYVLYQMITSYLSFISTASMDTYHSYFQSCTYQYRSVVKQKLKSRISWALQCVVKKLSSCYHLKWTTERWSRLTSLSPHRISRMKSQLIWAIGGRLIFPVIVSTL